MSLKESLDAKVSDPALFLQLLAKAIDVLAAKLDADAGVTDVDYLDVISAVDL